MIKGHSISLIVPCKNEQDSLGRMLSKVPLCIDEVIVVDNNSTDKTATVAKDYNARVFTEKRKDQFGIGYGFAHQTGMKKACGDIIVTMDGDNTYPMHEITKAVNYFLENNLDFVACSRFPLKNAKAISLLRKTGVWILNTQVRLFYQFPMQDILSGMWITRKNTTKLLKVKEGGWDLSPEIKLNALQHPKIRFGEFHIDHHHRSNGASKQQLWNTGFNHLTYIFKRRITQDSKFFQSLKKLFKPFPVFSEIIPALSE